MKSMRILGIDYGDRRIGLALSDRLQMTAQPLGVYESRGRKQNRLYFQDLVEEHKISKIVIGLPLMMDGSAGERAQKTKEFGDWLKHILQIPVIYWDERLSTKEAMRILSDQNLKGRKTKKYKDQVSAAIILSAFLESLR